MSKKAKEILRQNALAFIGPLPPRESGATRLTKKGLANGTALRLLGDTQTVQIDTIDALAKGFGVEP